MSKQDNRTGNVIPIRAGSKVEPPTNHADRLRARGSRLHMCAGPGEDENLVCLYDLVAWLVADRNLPLKRAIEQVASKVEAIDQRETFSMSQDDYAEPYNTDSPFHKYFDDGKSLAAASVRCLGMSAFELSKMMNGPGDRPDQSLEFDESKETPFEYFGRKDWCCHALTWRKAYELFGWGRVVCAAKGQAAQAVAEWRDEIELGHGRSKARYFQKADANTPLVRIVDVLADFAARLGLPTGEAMGDFLEAVNVPLLQEVYALRENHFAELVGAAHMYGQLTEAEAQKKTREAADYADEMRWDKYGAAGSVFKGVTTPLEALKQHIQEYGPQTSDKSLYAISHATANRLWSWVGAVPVVADAKEVAGKDAAPALPKKVKEKDKSPDWTGAKLAARHKELKAAWVKGFAEQAAKEAGISVREASRRIKVHKEGGATANVADQLVVVGVKNKAA